LWREARLQSLQSKNIDVDFSQAGKLGNGLLSQLNILREAEPVFWSEASHGWLITRHTDIDDALQGRFPLSLRRVENMMFAPLAPAERGELPTLQRFIRNWPIEMDPPEHTRLRKLLVKAFSRKVVEAVRPFVKERVAALMAKLERQPIIEFNEEIARPLPGSLILKLLGLPQDQLGRLRGWANAIVEAAGVPFADMQAKKRAEQAMVEMTELFAAQIATRRRAPIHDDLVTALIAASEDGESLTEDEMIGAMQLVLIAGHDTTSSTLTLGLATLIQHPEYWDYMYRNPDKMQESCLELMRYQAMSTAQPRVAAADFEWHGKSLRRGDFVWLMFAAGNRDPRVFADPEKIDPARINDRSLVFAPGLHHCIGHQLAKMQVTEFFGELVRRFAGAELLDPALNFMPQVVFRGLYHLNVRMHPRLPV
jgi:pimeloyl-[acyl-carrier protein] synthase